MLLELAAAVATLFLSYLFAAGGWQKLAQPGQLRQTIDDYRESVLRTLEVGGDCDTNCAIVGGIVTGYAGPDSIPDDWRRACEPLKPTR